MQATQKKQQLTFEKQTLREVGTTLAMGLLPDRSDEADPIADVTTGSFSCGKVGVCC